MKVDPIEELYHTLYQDLLAYGIFLANNKAQAEDLVSDAFYKLLLNIEKVPDTKRKYWLMHVMKNQHIDQIRKNKKYDYYANYQKVMDKDASANMNSLIGEIVVKESNKELFFHISNLKPVYAEILLLRYFLDFSIEEIAQYLAMTNGQVRTLLYRGRKLLKGRIEKYGE